MRGTVHLFSAFGIPIRLHWTFLALLPVLVLFAAPVPGASLAGRLIMVALLFACVACHELAHSVVAQSYGVRVREIVLLPIGGLASLDRVPEEPREEAAIAAAGPAFNLAAAAFLYLFIVFVPGIVFVGPLSSPRVFWDNPPFQSGVILLLWINVMMAVFNLLPAFPMDGGRLLRALLVWRGRPHVRATQDAVRVSKAMLVVFVIVGFLFGQVMLLPIALLLYVGANAESQAVRTRAALGQLRVQHLLPQRPATITPETPLGELVPRMLDSAQRHFPVLRRGRLLGIVCRPDLAAALTSDGGGERTAEALMRPALVVFPDEPLSDVQRRLAERGLPAACIVDRGRLIGLVSQDGLRILTKALDPDTE